MPEEYLGKVIELCEANRGEQKGLDFFHATQVILVYDLPAAQLVDDFFGKLKGATYVPSSILMRYLMLMDSQKGLCHARLRRFWVASKPACQAVAARQQAPRRCDLASSPQVTS